MKKLECASVVQKLDTESPAKKKDPVQKQKKEYKCSECSVIKNSRSVLLHHIKAMHENQRFQCSECFRLFTARDKCRAHVETEHVALNAGILLTNIKNGDDCIKCELCMGKFLSSADISVHMKHKHPKNFIAFEENF